jgi:protein TonB
VIQAIQRWKYKPKIVDGNPVKAFDVRERITFEFDQ